MRKRKAASYSEGNQICSPDIKEIQTEVGAIFLEMVEREHSLRGKPGAGLLQFLGYIKTLRKHGYPVPENLEHLANFYLKNAEIQTDPRRYKPPSEEVGKASVWHWSGVTLLAVLYTYGYDNWAKKQENPKYKNQYEFLNATLYAGMPHDLVEDYFKRHRERVFEIIRSGHPCAEGHILKLSDARPKDFEAGYKPNWFVRKSGIQQRNKEKDMLELLITLADKYCNVRDFRQEFCSHLTVQGNPDDYWKKFGGVGELKEPFRSEPGRGAVNTLWYLNLAAESAEARLCELDPERDFSGIWHLLGTLKTEIHYLKLAVNREYLDLNLTPPQAGHFISPEAGIALSP